jgi:DNA replication protein DnaC
MANDRITRFEVMGALGAHPERGRATGPTPSGTETGGSSSPRRTTTAIQYPDGRVAYPELGILAQQGESLAEARARKRRERVAGLFHEATIPAAFTEWAFATFPVDRAKRQAYEAAQRYASETPRANLLLEGSTGTGKTGLAVCILQARIELGVPSLFVSVPDLLDKIRATFGGHGDYTQLMDAVKTVDFLVLDDLGAHNATDWAREKLFQLLGYRHDWMLPTVITSDRPLRDLEKAIGRRTLARILERGQVVEVGGRDLRR